MKQITTVGSHHPHSPKIILILVTLLCAGIIYRYSNAYRDSHSNNSSKEVSHESVINHKLHHLGIVADGNRRWAKRSGLAPWLGHKQGVEPVKTTIRFCLDHHIPYLTLYAFSLENFKRPAQELEYLFDILAKELAHSELEELFNQGVCVRVIGDRTTFPSSLVDTIRQVEEKTKDNTKLIFTVLFCYGGQQEIIAATKELAHKVQAELITPENITKSLFEEHLWTGSIPAPDLIIRTGGMKRLSNFLTYYSAYSELYFLDCYWPEITYDHLWDALDEFTQRTRNFGS